MYEMSQPKKTELLFVGFPKNICIEVPIFGGSKHNLNDGSIFSWFRNYFLNEVPLYRVKDLFLPVDDYRV